MSNKSIDQKSDILSDNQHILDRLDRIPTLTRTQRRWITILASFYVFDMFDLALVSYSASAWRINWGASVAEIGAVASATFFGMFVGAIFGGRLSDRFGRKKVIIGGIVVVSVSSLATAFAPSILVIVLLRIVTGAGIQAMTSALLVFASEMMPVQFRGRFTAIIVALGFTAIPLAALSATLIVPISENSWRWLFVIGSLGALIAVTTSRKLSESARWLIVNGRANEAERIIQRLESESRNSAAIALPELRSAIATKPIGARDLFQGRAAD